MARRGVPAEPQLTEDGSPCLPANDPTIAPKTPTRPQRAREILFRFAPRVGARLALAAHTLALSFAFAFAPHATAAPADSPSPAAPPAPRIVRGLAYGPHGERNQLDLFFPATPPPAPHGYPVVIWIHGGGWTHGNKDSGGPARRLTAQGYVVAALNYRYATTAPFPAPLLDCQRAVRWLRAHAADHALDPRRLGVWGSSAGGHLAALLGTVAPDAFPAPADDPHRDRSAAVHAVCAYFPVTDLTRSAELSGRERPDSPVAQLLGGTAAALPTAARAASPVSHVTPDDAPFFLVHGTADPTVSPRQSELLHAALRDAGVESTLHLLPGAEHGGEVFRRLAPEAAIDAFFARHLRNAP